MASKKPARNQGSKKLSPWLQKLMGDRKRPLTFSSPIQATMPPLAFSIGEQIGRLGEKSRNQARLLTGHLNLSAPRGIHLSLLRTGFFRILRKPITILPEWQRMRDLFWFQRRPRSKNERQRDTNIYDQERLFDGTTEDTVADQSASIVTENHPPFTVVTRKMTESPIDYSYPDSTTSMRFSSESEANQPETQKTGIYNLPLAASVSRSHNSDQLQQYQRPGQQRIKIDENRQAGHIYRGQQSEPVWLPFTQTLLSRQVSLVRSSYPTSLHGSSYPPHLIEPPITADMTHSVIPGVQATPEPRRSGLDTLAAKAEMGRRAIEPRTQQNMFERTEATNLGKEGLKIAGSDSPLVGPNIRTFSPLLHREEHNEPGALFRESGQHSRQENLVERTEAKKLGKEGIKAADSYSPLAGPDIRTFSPLLQRKEYNEPGALFRKSGQYSRQQDIVERIGAMHPGKEGIQTTDNYESSAATPVSMPSEDGFQQSAPLAGMDMTLFYPTPAWEESHGISTGSEGFNRYPKSKVKQVKKLLSDRQILSQEKASRLPISRVVSSLAQKISRTGQSILRLSALPDILTRKGVTAKASQQSSSVISGHEGDIWALNTAGAMFGDRIFAESGISGVIPGRSQQTYQAEAPLLHRQLESDIASYRQPRSVFGETYPAADTGNELHLRSMGGMAIPDRNESPGVIWHQDKEPYLLRYDNSPSHKNIQRQMPQWPASEVVQMKESPRTADTKSLPPIFTERPSVPELTFAPLVQAAETAAPMIMRTEAETEQTETETTAPDIDDIARQVYPILKRRLARERERALGIS